jgi:RHS repeat-associated protein
VRSCVSRGGGWIEGGYDVPCSDADAGWIQTVYNHGTAAGCGSGQFCPDPPSGILNRAQMATFVVKGYRADGAATPACTGIFADVPCSGGSQWVPFAPYIEQLSRDNVTAGCGGSNFCPGNPVTPWQILVWMSKTPAVPGGVAWGAVYHPVPRGSIYTFRDEQNRVVTEMTGGSSGTASASLSVTRDNVFLGSLLVASNSSGSWNYSVSDHLGSVRTLWDTTGTVTETHKYWPYGEDTNTSPPSQHLAFALMERNDGLAQHYDHARSHQFNLGRFVSVDKVGGWPHNPQSWNRYTYASNNPLKMVDRNGLWSASVHNEIINKAFPGLTSQQRQILMRSSSRMDSPARGGQDPGRSYEHAMRGPGETADQARQKAIGFYEKNINDAKALQEKSGFWRPSLGRHLPSRSPRLDLYFSR